MIDRTISINAITYHKSAHDRLVQSLGGVEAIEAKLKTRLLFGERYYLSNILYVHKLFN